MRTVSHTSQIMQPWPLVLAAAWLLPGLGHAVCGHARRGAIVGVAVAVMFFAGLLIGGIDVIDRRNDTLWFAGQAMIGPIAFALDYAHVDLHRKREEQIEQYGVEHDLALDDYDPGDADDFDGPALKAMLDEGYPLAYRTSIGRVNELGTLYCTLAGVLNLLVILDAVGRAVQEPKLEPSGGEAS